MPEDVWAKAAGDAQFFEYFQAAYSGRHSAIDALWWYCNPLDTAPSGIASPASALDGVRHKVFSTRDEKTRQLQSEKLTELLQSLEEDHREIMQAIAIAETRASPGLAETPAPPDSQTPLSEPPTHHSSGPTRKSRVPYLLLIAGALVAGLWIGSTLSPAMVPEDLSATAIPNAPSTLTVFDRDQTPNDIPSSPIGPEFRAESIRRLTVQTGIEEEFFVARGQGERICLIVVPQDGLYSASCVDTSEFASSGLRVNWAARHPAPFLTDTDESILMDGVITCTSIGAGTPTLTPRQ